MILRGDYICVGPFVFLVKFSRCLYMVAYLVFGLFCVFVGICESGLGFCVWFPLRDVFDLCLMFMNLVLLRIRGH
jgi:hypothetical protein